MNSQIQANKRLVYINTLPSARELHQFIQYLDQKYGVDSTDPNNTFGRVYLDQPIIQHGVSNTLYFAGISSSDPNDLRLPTYQAIPHANSVVVIDKIGNVGLATSQAHIKAKRVPITVQDDDIKKLIQLRNQFKAEIEAHTPLEPDFKEKTNHGFVDKNGNQISFRNLHRWQQTMIYDRLLKEQGFATDKENRLSTTILVPNFENELKEFEVRFYRLGFNNAPYFSTTYDGWQNQKEMDHSHPAYQFYTKWHVFHTHNMTIDEWLEMKADLEELVEVSKSDSI